MSLYEKLKSFEKTLPGSGGQSDRSPTSIPADSKSSTAPSRHESPVLKQLRSMPGILLARELEGHQIRREKDRDEFLSSLGGDILETEQGAFWRRDRSFACSTLPVDPRTIDESLLPALGDHSELANLSPGQLLFIDTETTGLSGGAGTVAFLVGVGWCEGDRFIVRQYLMRDYDEEPVMLIDLLSHFRNFPALVTYNGKGFDVPLLQTRFVMQRLQVALDDWPHLDLLFAARRLWKARCRSCTLGNMERHILGISERAEDIPGAEIPAVYFDFIRGRRIERLRPVLEHNVQDIVSLAMLAARAGTVLAAPQAEHPLDRWSVGRWRYLDTDFEEAVRWLESALSDGLPLAECFIALQYIGRSHRRAGDYSAARGAWQRLTADRFPPHPMPWIELAKIAEHKDRDYRAALEHVDAALGALQTNRNLSGCSDSNDWPDQTRLTSPAFQRFQEDLVKRRERLERKCKNRVARQDRTPRSNQEKRSKQHRS